MKFPCVAFAAGAAVFTASGTSAADTVISPPAPIRWQSSTTASDMENDVYTKCVEVQGLELGLKQEDICEILDVLTYCLERTKRDLTPEQTLFHNSATLRYCNENDRLCKKDCFNLEWGQDRDRDEDERDSHEDKIDDGPFSIPSLDDDLEEYSGCVYSKEVFEQDDFACAFVRAARECEASIDKDYVREYVHFENTEYCIGMEGCEACSSFVGAPDLKPFYECQGAIFDAKTDVYERNYTYNADDLELGRWTGYDFGNMREGANDADGEVQDTEECGGEDVSECLAVCADQPLVSHCLSSECSAECYEKSENEMCYYMMRISYQLAFPECHSEATKWGVWKDVSGWEGWSNETDVSTWEGVVWEEKEDNEDDRECGLASLQRDVHACYTDHREVFGEYYTTFLKLGAHRCRELQEEKDECALDCKWFHDQIGSRDGEGDGQDGHTDDDDGEQTSGGGEDAGGRGEGGGDNNGNGVGDLIEDEEEDVNLLSNAHTVSLSFAAVVSVLCVVRSV